MKLSFVVTAALAVLVSAEDTASPLTFTYQTLSNGEVQFATTTYSSASVSQSVNSSSSGTATRYTLQTEDLAYPTFSSIPPAIASAAAGPSLPDAQTFAKQALSLVALGKNSSETNCQACRDLMVKVQDSARLDQEFIGRIAEPFCDALSAFVPRDECVALLRTGSTDVGAIFGSYGTDILAQDGQLLCTFLLGLCQLPAPPILDLEDLFQGTTKPAPKSMTPSSKPPLKVLHISDYHLDPRYVVGSEADCGGGLFPTVCCRVYPYTNTSAPINTSAALFGNYQCDTPEPLATSVFRAVPGVTGFEWQEFAFGIFTGDLVSHDIWELTPEYVTANELISYQQFFDGMDGVKVYPTLGNHDTFPQGFTSFPQDNIFLPANASYPVQQQYTYENVSEAWQNYGWLSADEAQQVVTSGLGIYRAKTAEGLTIISLNSDVWYYINLYAYISANDFDPTGTFKMLINMLLEAEKNDEPVWLIQHVNIGGSVSYEALPAASDLYYQIIDRFNNTIRATFFGHTHNDEFGVFYTNNGTLQTPDTAASVAYIGPSVTPYTNLNPGFRYYLVDADTFNVIDSINFYANLSDTDSWTTAGDVTWQRSYSARETYDPDGSLLGDVINAPLTAAFWHQVAENIKSNDTVFREYVDLRSKLFRPYTEPEEVMTQRIKCGLTSMSVPIFEECLGSMDTINSFL